MRKTIMYTATLVSPKGTPVIGLARYTFHEIIHACRQRFMQYHDIKKATVLDPQGCLLMVLYTKWHYRLPKIPYMRRKQNTCAIGSNGRIISTKRGIGPQGEIA